MRSTIRLALYQPDIPQNTGACMRTAACLGVGVDIIGPAGFALSDKQMRRAGMDYLDRLDWTNHVSWQTFQAQHLGRLVLLTTKAETSYIDFAFAPGDTLLAGRESAGVPDDVQAAADAKILVPMLAGMRSLNVAASLAMVLGEALRQTGAFPKG
ncbi:MAG: tRNA (cytidine(34)-2'-O)-methyltransferase [Proteobacteria bacterium]|nr:tRNA (cytidine(34)-2'-O)-methyltransferase [Pseudomonadota bacterium]MDA1022965.1 tRNA (cytidine(34)-2'-O)-methyltransferase [Pseudomonadota bacterium]